MKSLRRHMTPALLIVFLAFLSPSTASATPWPTLGEIRARCAQQFLDFVSVFDCTDRLQSSLQPSAARAEDLMQTYFAYGNALKARVRQGVISEADATLGLTLLYNRIKTTDMARWAQREADRSARLQLMLEGLAQWQSATNQPPPTPSLPLTIITPRGMVSCTQTGNVVSCF